MMTRVEFLKKWRHHLAGLALYGSVSAQTEGPLARAARAYDIPAEVENLLLKMYDDLVRPRPALPPTNGVAPPTKNERTL
jgi:hypothetical protein